MFPSVSVSGFTPSWLMYHSWRGNRFAAVDKAHKVLASVVRIAPDHVSFSDPSAYKVFRAMVLQYSRTTSMPT